MKSTITTRLIAGLLSACLLLTGCAKDGEDIDAHNKDVDAWNKDLWGAEGEEDESTKDSSTTDESLSEDSSEDDSEGEEESPDESTANESGTDNSNPDQTAKPSAKAPTSPPNYEKSDEEIVFGLISVNARDMEITPNTSVGDLLRFYGMRYCDYSDVFIEDVPNFYFYGQGYGKPDEDWLERHENDSSSDSDKVALESEDEVDKDTDDSSEAEKEEPRPEFDSLILIEPVQNGYIVTEPNPDEFDNYRIKAINIRSEFMNEDQIYIGTTKASGGGFLFTGVGIGMTRKQVEDSGIGKGLQVGNKVFYGNSRAVLVVEYNSTGEFVMNVCLVLR